MRTRSCSARHWSCSLPWQRYLAAASHWFALRRLRRNEPLGITQSPLSITLAIMLAVLTLASLWRLVR